MKIHEYQAKNLMRLYDIQVPRGITADTGDAAAAAFEKLNPACGVVIKSQIHAGGRGKAGGIRKADTPEEAKSAAEALLNKVLVTAQTGPEGKTVRQVLVEEAFSVEHEYYLSFVLGAEDYCIYLIISEVGGMDIEAVAAETPERIHKIKIDPEAGLLDYQVRRASKQVGVPESLKKSFAALCRRMYRLFCEKECSLVEINPLVLCADGRLLPLDCKMIFDDNSLFRHPEIEELRDVSQEDPREAEASLHGMSFVSLQGDIGCIVNGAGLAMATMDAIHRHGGHPANFLDLGGGADKDRVYAALRLLLSDESIAVVLINIFGGITSCRAIAEGLADIVKEIKTSVRLVVRLEGLEKEAAYAILKNTCYPFTVAGTLTEAAQKAVKLGGGR